MESMDNIVNLEDQILTSFNNLKNGDLEMG